MAHVVKCWSDECEVLVPSPTVANMNLNFRVFFFLVLQGVFIVF